VRHRLAAPRCNANAGRSGAVPALPLIRDSTTCTQSIFDCTEASVCDADALNHVYHAAGLSHGLPHDCCKFCLHKAREHLD